MVQELLNDLKKGTLLVVYDALEGTNQRDLEIVTSPTGFRVPDNELVNVMDDWYRERFHNMNIGLRRRGETALARTSLAPPFLLPLYIDRDPDFSRDITDKRKGRPFNSYMKGTRLSPSGIAIAESLLYS